MARNRFLLDRRRLLRLYTDGAVFCAFDTETTGLSASSGRIVEIGAVLFDKDGIRGSYSELVNPGCPMPPEASRVNNITDDMLRGRPPVGQTLPGFLAFIGEAVLVAHNAGFDLKFVNTELERSGLSALRNTATDTLRLARSVFPDMPNHRLQTLAGRLGIKAERAHRAYDDALICMELFTRCLSGTR